jgi:hypothetical protein
MNTKRVPKKISSGALTVKSVSPATGPDEVNPDSWKLVGYFGPCAIYALGNARRLLDTATGSITFQFNISD